MNDNAFIALAHIDRRRILVALLEDTPLEERTAGLDDVATDGSLRRIHLERQHVHLPKLDEMGFIDWGRTDGELTKGPRFGELQPVLEFLTTEHEQPARLPNEQPQW